MAIIVVQGEQLKIVSITLSLSLNILFHEFILKAVFIAASLDGEKLLSLFVKNQNSWLAIFVLSCFLPHAIYLHFFSPYSITKLGCLLGPL